METSIKFTVYYEGAFWVGIFEKITANNYEVSKVIFGPEPKDYEVYDFILKNFCRLKFSKYLKIDEVKDKKINPKRLQREIKKQTENSGIGTKAQIAMKLQYEANKNQRKINSREKREQEKEERFKLHQIKQKEKHRGH